MVGLAESHDVAAPLHKTIHDSYSSPLVSFMDAFSITRGVLCYGQTFCRSMTHHARVLVP